MVHARKCVVAALATLRLVGVPAARQSGVFSRSGFRVRQGPLSESGSAVRPVPNLLVQATRFSCCAKVDLPPPREIFVEYEEKPEFTDYFIQFADGIENADSGLMVLGNPDEMLPRDGSFEVKAGQHVLFSKLQAKRLPRVEEILLALEQLPREALSCELVTDNKAATA